MLNRYKGCSWTSRNLGPYLDGELPPGTAQKVKDHLSSCPRCHSEMETLQRLKGLMRETTLPSLSPMDEAYFWPRVKERIARETPRPGWRLILYRFWDRILGYPRLALASMVLLLAVLSLVVFEAWELKYMPGQPALANAAVIESLKTDDPKASLMVYTTPFQGMKVIWVFEESFGANEG